jgi:PiT family inorganic phosphate transporter
MLALLPAIALLPALYMGWGIGAHDAANTFGPQIGANIISHRRAVALAALFAFLGAIVEGRKVFTTLGGITHLTLATSIAATLSAALTVNVITAFGLPMSTSHTIVGALVGAGLFEGTAVNIPTVLKIGASMMTAPVGAGVVAYLLYRLLAAVASGRLGSLMLFERVVRYGAVVIGCYAAYALGSNNVGNAMATAVAVGLVGPGAGAALGGLAIAVGVLTYSRNLIMLVGRRITALDPISALVAVLATAITVHLFTQLGIPVSTSQATVGAVVGVGLTKGMVAVNRRMFALIPTMWVISIVGAGLMTYLLLAGYALLH